MHSNYKTHETMVKNYLFSPVFRKIGYALLAIALVYYVACWIWEPVADFICIPMLSLTPGMEADPEKFHFGIQSANAGWFEVVMTLMCVGCVFVAFSREKVEDEFIAHIRVQSLVWALMVNMVLVLLTTLFIYGGSYLICMAVYPFSTFLFFVIKYNWSLYKFRKNNEE